MSEVWYHAEDYEVKEVRIEGRDPQYPDFYIRLLNGSGREIETSYSFWSPLREEAEKFVIAQLERQVIDCEERLSLSKQRLQNYLGGV